MTLIDVLPDDVLLGIFDFYVDDYESFWDKSKWRIEVWVSLVHVCRRWRSLVLGSPRGLNLRLCCTPETPAKDTLDVWPAFPLIVNGDMSLSDTDNIIAALGQSNRVCQVYLFSLARWQLEEVLAEMQVPFPELTELRLCSDGETLSVIPDSFLNGSAPRLRILGLHGILFPGLPKLSASHLVELWLNDIPHSGYMSPEAMVTLISVFSSLRKLSLGFRSPQSRPDWETRSLSLSKRSILPALRAFYFKGVTEYLEELVTFIDTPQLEVMDIKFFNQIDFNCPRLIQFLNCTPTLWACDKAHLKFDYAHAEVGFSSGPRGLWIRISCREPADWQLSSLEQVCNSSLPPLSMVQDLYIEQAYSLLVWKNDAIENTLWLQLFLPFTAVKNLYLSDISAPDIATALQELVGSRITEVLPSLQNIFVEGLETSGPFQENIGRFVAARQLSDSPIVVSDWVKYPIMTPT